MLHYSYICNHTKHILKPLDYKLNIATMSQVLIPPPFFGMVEEDLYRCGEPNELSYPFLERLDLKTILYISSDDPSRDL